MNKFGLLKNKMLNKFTDSYSSGDKSKMKSILKLIKENKDLKDLYLFYEEIENLELPNKESAELYVENLERLLNEKNKTATKGIKDLNKLLENISVDENELYSNIDILSESTTLKNLDKKILAKKNLVEHIVTKKEVKKQSETTTVSNENLLYAVLANNFNVLYNNTLSEDQKNKLKDIVNLSEEDLKDKTNHLKESIINSVNGILVESKDDNLISKLNNVKKEVKSMEVSKFNYYRLIELKNGLI